MQEPQQIEWPAWQGPAWQGPEWQTPAWQDPRWQGTEGASGSGGGANPNYPPFYNDLCSRFDGWNANFEEMRKSNEEVRKSIEEVKTSFEERNKVEDERWEEWNRRDQGLRTWAQNMGYGSNPPPPGLG